MNENLNYISDEELEKLICQVEQDDLVAAPPDLSERIFEAAGLRPKTVEGKPKVAKKKEFYSYCFRVITSVAAAVALVFLLPELSGWMEQNVSPDFVQTVYRQVIPSYEEVVAPVPSKAEVVAAKATPSKEEVLNDTGFIERVINSTGWFDKESKNSSTNN